MDYGRFVRLRKPAWDAFESRLEAARSEPGSLGHEDLERLALEYRQVLHDQALAAARFPGSGVARRLHHLSLGGHRWLARGRQLSVGDVWSGFVRFWWKDFPLSFRRLLPTTGIALGVFAVAALFGLVLTVFQPGTATAFLTPDVVRALDEGRIWTDALREIPGPVAGSLIATNNIKVALLGWIGGVTAGLLSLYVLLLNGVMLGSVVGVTQHYSMDGALLEFVSAHGPLEISLILATAGAGLAVARAMLAAEDRPRREALVEAGRDALFLFLGTVPWFVILGTVEAIISPDPTLEPGFKVGVGVALEALFLLVAWNPWLRPEALSREALP